MENIVENLSLIDFIYKILYEIYPVSFIIIVLGTFGYLMAFVKFLRHARIKEKQIDIVDRLIERSH